MPNRKKAPSGMYTAQEAIAVIGIPATSFYTLVNEKTIMKITMPNRKEGTTPRPRLITTRGT